MIMSQNGPSMVYVLTYKMTPSLVYSHCIRSNKNSKYVKRKKKLSYIFFNAPPYPPVKTRASELPVCLTLISQAGLQTPSHHLKLLYTLELVFFKISPSPQNTL